MCGIAGILHLDGADVIAETLRRMTDRLAHRGPDGEGYWVHPERFLGLGHRRLAILDRTPAAAQPMHYEGRYTITYNGEVYNYLELREDLRKSGYAFRTESDTEVVLAAYAAYGEDCVDRFDGMFAFALWDERERRLFCARDRFGEKPFYYHFSPRRRFLFASEMKALFVAGVPGRLDDELLFNYLAYDVVQVPGKGDRTFYSEVRALEPGHTLTLTAAERTQPQPRRYWSIPQGRGGRPIALADAAEGFLELLTRSVRRRLRADVPLGSSLSGGIDSSFIVCLLASLREANGPPQDTFSARFDDEALDEGRYIEMVVKGRCVQPHYAWPGPEGLAAEIPKVFYHQEEPFSTASIFAQWEVMKLARSSGTIVLLDGQGADEVLGGYLHFFRPFLCGLARNDLGHFRRERAAFEKLRGRPFRADRRFWADAFLGPLVRVVGQLDRRMRAPKHLRWLGGDLVAAFRRESPPFTTFRCLDDALRFFTQDYGLRSLLRFADRNSMAFSREIRLPYLSHELVKFAFSLPESHKICEGWTKRVLREAAKDLVPDAIRLRVDKLGFQPPQTSWMGAPPVRKLVEEARRSLVHLGMIKPIPLTADREWRTLMVWLLVGAESRLGS